MSDVPTIETTGGSYKGREGLVIKHKDGRIVITGWYDGWCGLDVEVNMPVDEFMQRLRLPNDRMTDANASDRDSGGSHDVSIGEMIDAEDEQEMGLLGRPAVLQFVRLAAGYNELKEQLRAAVASKEQAERERDEARKVRKVVVEVSGGVAYCDDPPD